MTFDLRTEPFIPVEDVIMTPELQEDIMLTLEALRGRRGRKPLPARRVELPPPTPYGDLVPLPKASPSPL